VPRGQPPAHRGLTAPGQPHEHDVHGR
jgi:hypothetical protein